MKKTLRAFMILTLACSCQHSKENGTSELQDLETVNNLKFVDPASSSLISYPLICVEEGEYPNGVEFIFQKTENPDKIIHVVFPQGIEAPQKADNEFSMKGRFQKIRNESRFVLKKPPEDYRYFVVEAWRHED